MDYLNRINFRHASPVILSGKVQKILLVLLLPRKEESCTHSKANISDQIQSHALQSAFYIHLRNFPFCDAPLGF